jgi:hypothetical protein
VDKPLYAIDPADLPYYIVERKTCLDEWTRFTMEPHATREECEAHRLEVIEYFKGVTPEVLDIPERLRVTHYTKELWHQDLIKLALKDEEAVARLLTTIRPEQIALALNEGHSGPIGLPYERDRQMERVRSVVIRLEVDTTKTTYAEVFELRADETVKDLLERVDEYVEDLKDGF